MPRLYVPSTLRKTGLIELARTNIRVPTDRGWPICNLCIDYRTGRFYGVDSVEMVDSTAKSVTFLGKHHGREDAVRVDFDHRWRDDDLQVAFRAITFFHEGLRS